ncbi:transposase [Bacteroidetes/Chlorobi group bacterium MS-B_bin-24]|nr:MAG: transposase [Bacteroidetes/Chlorobi group bacterium MS-B_bin-24]
MKYNPQIHHRRSIRLQGYDYSQNGAYFITLCTHNRECLFGQIQNGQMILNEYGKIVEQCWNNLSNHYDNIELDAYVIMPNHFHGIILITDNVDNVDNVRAIRELPIHELPIHELPRQQQKQRQQQRRKMLLPKIVGRFKMNSAKQINQMRNTPGISVWQRNYYEHIIRDEKSLENIRNYIINNPAKWQDDDYNLTNR